LIQRAHDVEGSAVLLERKAKAVSPVTVPVHASTTIESSEPASPLEYATRADDRRVALVLVTMTGIFFVWLLALTVSFPWPLFDPDESLYAVITQEMIQSHQWLVPTYEGKAFLDRPAPYFWVLAASSILFGDHEFAYRLPNLLFGMGTVVMTGFLAARRFGSLVGAATSVCLMTMTSLIAMSMTVGHDTPLLFFTMASIVVWDIGNAARISNRWPARVLMVSLLAMSLGAGVLSKGLLGLVLPGIGILALSFVSTQRRGLVDLALATLIAGVLGACWYLAVERASPGYLKYFFFDRHVLGFFTSTQRHGNQSRFIYFATLLVGGAPWVFLFLAPLKQFVRDRSRWTYLLKRPLAPIVIWSTAIFLLFFLARSVSPTYLLPLFPPLSIGAGFWVSRWLTTGSTGHRSMDSYLREMPVIIVMLTCLTIPAVLIWFQRPWIFPVLACGIVLTATAFARLFLTGRIARALLRRSIKHRVIHMGIVCSLLAMICGFVVIETLPDVARERSTRSVVDILRKLPRHEAADIFWFNGNPPSARYYGPDLNIRPIYFRDMQQGPTRPTIVITRVSRKDEVQSAPFSKSSRWIDTNGRYRIMLSENF